MAVTALYISFSMEFEKRVLIMIWFWCSKNMGKCLITTYLPHTHSWLMAQLHEKCMRCCFPTEQSLADLPWILIGSLTFAGVFLPMWAPMQSIWAVYAVLVALEAVAWGLGYLVSVLARKYVSAW